jgi:hypothetical protein
VASLSIAQPVEAEPGLPLGHDRRLSESGLTIEIRLREKFPAKDPFAI